MGISFKSRNYSIGLRVWHWLDAIVVVGLIVTFFLRNGLVSSSRFLIQKLNENGIGVSDEIAKPLIRESIDQLWVWHVYLGYVLTALFVFRVILFFTDKKNPVLECWHSICHLKTRFDFRDIHHAGVRTGYAVFYLLQIFMILSGLALAFDKSLGLGKDFRHLVNDSHETVMWFFLAFVFAHIAGVFIAENRDDPGIVSALIHGDE